MKVSFNFEFNFKCVDQVPVVIYELNESAINFISQESFEKALILLQKAQTMLEPKYRSVSQTDNYTNSYLH